VVDTDTLRVDSIPRLVRSWMSRMVATAVPFVVLVEC
jgi:hypothetical protein